MDGCLTVPHAHSPLGVFRRGMMSYFRKRSAPPRTPGSGGRERGCAEAVSSQIQHPNLIRNGIGSGRCRTVGECSGPVSSLLHVHSDSASPFPAPFALSVARCTMAARGMGFAASALRQAGAAAAAPAPVAVPRAVGQQTRGMGESPSPSCHPSSLPSPFRPRLPPLPSTAAARISSAHDTRQNLARGALPHQEQTRSGPGLWKRLGATGLFRNIFSPAGPTQGGCSALLR